MVAPLAYPEDTLTGKARYRRAFLSRKLILQVQVVRTFYHWPERAAST